MPKNWLNLAVFLWVPKNAEFYTDSKSKDKIEKKGTNKKLFVINLAKTQFFIITFYLFTLFEFCFWIWKQHKILRILIPILANLSTSYFFQNRAENFFPLIGQFGKAGRIAISNR